jgi:hypothetical protein
MANIKKHSLSRKQVKYKSFKVCEDVKPFVQFNITEQTVYWSTLLIFILIMALFVLSIQLNTQSIFNSINI